ncbi:MAG: trypsin-like serine protease [Myxococcaceae bacterium]|nr:trypsin-like serine protease [Myxococcaceae bacterium]
MGSLLSIYPGPADVANRYASSVIVIRTTDGRDEPEGGCSGVLIDPSLVLTAGHCVCEMRTLRTADDKALVGRRLEEAVPSAKGSERAREDPARTWREDVLARSHAAIDGSQCSMGARVLALEYVSPAMRPDYRSYRGVAIRPHPRLLILDGTDGKGLFREADLAIIRLEKPVNENLRTIKLPQAEIQREEPIIMVGFGRGETDYANAKFGYRHVGEGRVTKVERLASGGMKFAAGGSAVDGELFSVLHGGDSGGGAFKKDDDTVLVGIASSLSADRKTSIYTSTYPYKKWLEGEKAAARQTSP